jgi:cytoskeleton protein RodZ
MLEPVADAKVVLPPGFRVRSCKGKYLQAKPGFPGILTSRALLNMTKATQMSFDEDGGTARRRIHLREISGDSEAPLETVGQDLRAARLRRGDDLATVSRSLKIRKDHLEAVEEDNFAGLPGKTYAIGFVRSYSGYLGLDPAKTVERYKQEISGRHDGQSASDSSFHIEETSRLPYGWRIVAGVVGLLLIYGVWHLVSAGPTAQPVPPPPSLAPPRPQVVAAKPAPAPPATQPATGDTAVPPPAANTSSAPTPQAALPNDGNMSSGVAAAVPAVGPTVAAPSVIGASGEVFGQNNMNPRVVLRARDETKLTVRGADGTLYLNKDLKAGDSYQVPNLPGLSLATSNAGGVDVVVDGLDKGRVGQNQQILGHVSLEPQSLVERFNSH